MDCLEAGPDAFIPKKALYSDFAAYCRALALPASGQETFYKNLPKHMTVTDFRAQLGKERWHCIRGIRYKVGDPSALSKVSTLSRVFYTLTPPLQNASYEIEVVGGYSRVRIRVPQTLDTLDTLDSRDIIERCRAAIGDVTDTEGNFAYEDAAGRALQHHGLTHDQFNTTLEWLRDHDEVSKVGETRYYWLGHQSPPAPQQHVTGQEKASGHRKPHRPRQEEAIQP
jgi:hypothetical protein